MINVILTKLKKKRGYSLLTKYDNKALSDRFYYKGMDGDDTGFGDFSFDYFINKNGFFFDDNDLEKAISGTIINGNLVKWVSNDHIVLKAASRQEAWEELQIFLLIKEII